MNITIEKGIEIPKFEQEKLLEKITPIKDLEINDSFLFPSELLVADNILVTRVSAYGKAKNKEFITRKMPEGRRVWRIK